MDLKIPIQKSKQQIKFYKKYGKVFGKVLFDIYNKLKDGSLQTGLEVEEYYEQYIAKLADKETSGTLDYSGYPFIDEKNHLDDSFGYSICVSIDDTVAHGKPTDKKFRSEDIISIDFGLSIPFEDNYLYFDSAFTIEYGVDTQSNWVVAPHKALKNIIKNQCYNTYTIADTIHQTAANNFTNVITQLTGHGIGNHLHEPPLIRNMVGKYSNEDLFDSLVFCAEPIFTKEDGPWHGIKIEKVFITSDGWSIKTISGQPASHFETMFCMENNKLVDLCGITDWQL